MALWNALRPLLLKEIVLLGMKQMFNISGFSRLSRLVSLQTCTCPSPQVSQGCSHLFFSLILGVIIWKKTPKESREVWCWNQLLLLLYTLVFCQHNGQGQHPATGVTQVEDICGMILCFQNLDLHSLLSCVLNPPCSFCTFDFIFAFLMP